LAETSFLVLHRESVLFSQINYKDTHNEIELKINYIKSQIMKKLATTFGLLALMLIVTSFTTPNEVGGKGTGLGNGGNIYYEVGGKGTGLGNGGNIYYEVGGKGTGLGNGGNIQ
jgi:hypothetical protein